MRETQLNFEVQGIHVYITSQLNGAADTELLKRLNTFLPYTYTSM